jgi:uncharacterized membrane protein YkoI
MKLPLKLSNADMNRLLQTGMLLIALASTALAASEPDAKLLRQTKLTRAQAEKIALERAHGGTVKSGELEREKKHLVWSFDIASAKSRDITEVLVDAINGQIISVQTETPRDQAAEARADRAGK